MTDKKPYTHEWLQYKKIKMQEHLPATPFFDVPVERPNFPDTQSF